MTMTVEGTVWTWQRLGPNKDIDLQISHDLTVVNCQVVEWADDIEQWEGVADFIGKAAVEFLKSQGLARLDIGGGRELVFK